MRLVLFGLATAHDALSLDDGDIIQIVQTYLILVIRLLDVWTEAVIFLMLFRLSVDILMIHGAERPDTNLQFRSHNFTFNTERLAKNAANVMTIVISVLVLLVAIILGSAYDKIMGFGQEGYANPSEFADIVYQGSIPRASAQMNLTIIVLLWILSLLVVARSFMVFLRCRRDALVRKVSSSTSHASLFMNPHKLLVTNVACYVAEYIPPGRLYAIPFTMYLRLRIPPMQCQFYNWHEEVFVGILYRHYGHLLQPIPGFHLTHRDLRHRSEEAQRCLVSG